MLSLRHQLRYTLIAIVAPIIRIFPPWWKARFYGRIVGDHFGKMGGSGCVKRRRVSPHYYKMELQLDDPMERFAYFVGCYWGIDVTATVLRLLRRGDYFIDVGANLGFLTLTASKKVGPEGKVFSFEPLVAMADRLHQTLLSNMIENVTIYQYALGDVKTEGMLDHDDHSSKANLRHPDNSGEKIQIMPGDHVLGNFPEDTWVFAKLDVEGYELRVLKGFESLVNSRYWGLCRR
jgi:FkbM family methyltransferase